MNYFLSHHKYTLSGELVLESSKSESNRMLLIQALSKDPCEIKNLSHARDTFLMHHLLQHSQEKVWDVQDAGTTMRFLTAFLALRGNQTVITGTQRMTQRPIGALVDSLTTLGTNIEYIEKQGYPPLRISKIRKQKTSFLEISGNISSQYITALALIAPCLTQGLKIKLTTEVYSLPYLQMTLSLMNYFGVTTSWKANEIDIPPQSYRSGTYRIEGDWSGASYWYAFVALAPKGSALTLSYLKKESLQGDQSIAKIMQNLGVKSTFKEGKVIIKNTGEMVGDTLTLQFKDCPDLAQTVMVVAAVKNITLNMLGLESLQIKETDRIQAMTQELSKINAILVKGKKYWVLHPSTHIPETVTIETYRDHRMAMAFAPLSQKTNVKICDYEVVQKSYPDFWKHVRQIGIAATRC